MRHQTEESDVVTYRNIIRRHHDPWTISHNWYGSLNFIVWLCDILTSWQWLVTFSRFIKSILCLCVQLLQDYEIEKYWIERIQSVRYLKMLSYLSSNLYLFSHQANTMDKLLFNIDLRKLYAFFVRIWKIVVGTSCSPILRLTILLFTKQLQEGSLRSTSFLSTVLAFYITVNS